MSLEEKIKLLMEGKPNQEKDDDVDDQGQADDGNDDADDKDVDGTGKNVAEKDDDENTDLALDGKKKDKIVVKEDATPGQTKDVVSGSEESGSEKTSRIKLGLGKKESSGSLKDTATADKQDDAGDNAKIQAGAKKRDVGGKLSDKQTQTEHIEALFQGETLSEEFQSKAATIFEAAVNSVIAERTEKLEEEYALLLDKELNEAKLQIESDVNDSVEQVITEMVDSVDGFLEVVVEQWVADNQVALEGGIKVELVNSFVDGLKGLFKEHYIDIPDEKVSIVEEQAADIEALKVKLQEAEERSKTLAEELIVANANLVFEAVAESLTDVQKDKFCTLIESVEFVDAESYAEKIQTIKEAYFPDGKTKQTQTTQTKSVISESNQMNDYVAAVAKKIKF